MNFEFATESEIRIELGKRIAQQRIKKNLTQVELAHQAAIGVATLKRLENGEGATLTNFIRVLTALGKVSDLSQLAVESMLSIESFEAIHAASQRKRVSGKLIKKG